MFQDVAEESTGESSCDVGKLARLVEYHSDFIRAFAVRTGGDPTGWAPAKRLNFEGDSRLGLSGASRYEPGVGTVVCGWTVLRWVLRAGRCVYLGSDREIVAC